MVSYVELINILRCVKQGVKMEYVMKCICHNGPYSGISLILMSSVFLISHESKSVFFPLRMESPLNNWT